MPHIPLNAYAIKRSNEIATLALARRLRPSSPWYLFTGGKYPMIVHLTGDYAGHGHENDGWGQSDMVVFENVEIEVVDASMEQATVVNMPPCAIVLAPGKTGITAARTSRGLADECFVFFNDHDPESALPSPLLFFREWRIVKQIGEKRQALFEYRSDKDG